MSNPYATTIPVPAQDSQLSIVELSTNSTPSPVNPDANPDFPFATYYRWGDGALEYRSGLWSDPVMAQRLADAANERMGATAVVVVDERTMQVVEAGTYHYVPGEVEAVERAA